MNNRLRYTDRPHKDEPGKRKQDVVPEFIAEIPEWLVRSEGKSLNGLEEQDVSHKRAGIEPTIHWEIVMQPRTSLTLIDLIVLAEL
jgi:hypothetical protein